MTCFAEARGVCVHHAPAQCADWQNTRQLAAFPKENATQKYAVDGADFGG